MSVAGILDAMRADIPPAHRIVWQCLENHANGARFWAITCEAIATEVHLSLMTVRRAIEALEKADIIRGKRHARRPTTYFMQRKYAKGGAELESQNEHPSAFESQNEHPTPTLDTAQNEHLKPLFEDQKEHPTADFGVQNEPYKESTSKSPPEKSPPEVARAPARARRTRTSIETDWRPSEAGIAYAEQHGVDVAVEVPKFVNHHTAKGNRMADWAAAWRTWCNNDQQWRPSRHLRVASVTPEWEFNPNKLSGAPRAMFNLMQERKALEEQDQRREAIA